jgi:hypothetical protein
MSIKSYSAFAGSYVSVLGKLFSGNTLQRVELSNRLGENRCLHTVVSPTALSANLRIFVHVAHW